MLSSFPTASTMSSFQECGAMPLHIHHKVQTDPRTGHYDNHHHNYHDHRYHNDDHNCHDQYDDQYTFKNQYQIMYHDDDDH